MDSWDPFALDPIPVQPSSNDQNDISGELSWPGVDNGQSQDFKDPSEGDWPGQVQASDQGVINQAFFANNLSETNESTLEKTLQDDKPVLKETSNSNVGVGENSVSRKV